MHARDLCSDLNILKIIKKWMEQRISYFFLPSWCFHYAVSFLFSNAWHYPYLWILILSICAYSGSYFNCSTKALNQLSVQKFISHLKLFLYFFFSVRFKNRMVIDGVQPHEWKSELTFSIVAENQKNCQERGRKSVLLVFPVRGIFSYGKLLCRLIRQGLSNAQWGCKIQCYQ